MGVLECRAATQPADGGRLVGAAGVMVWRVIGEVSTSRVASWMPAMSAGEEGMVKRPRFPREVAPYRCQVLNHDGTNSELWPSRSRGFCKTPDMIWNMVNGIRSGAIPICDV